MPTRGRLRRATGGLAAIAGSAAARVHKVTLQTSQLQHTGIGCCALEQMTGEEIKQFEEGLLLLRDPQPLVWCYFAVAAHRHRELRGKRNLRACNP